MKQKDVFLQSEGDAWYQRNTAGSSAAGISDADPLLGEILDLRPRPARNAKILEIGCGDGARLQRLSAELGCECHGIDPSARAVAAARARGVTALQGTADQLPFADRMFEIVIFGFCLYVCDRADLFRLAYEADRVLLSPGWLLIHDFYSPAPIKRAYHHRPGLFCHKMDFRSMFTWHPAYTTYTHKIRGHVLGDYTDVAEEWVATSVLRKLPDGV
jgi:ubiquinone/menaquinone biosynthesis C-methylase UbiE